MAKKATKTKRKTGRPRKVVAEEATNIEEIPIAEQDKNKPQLGLGIKIEEKKAGRPKKFTKVRVHRSNVDPDNKDTIISVCVNSPAERKRFWPGEEVKLTEAQIGVLKNSVDEVRIEIPSDSGIYQSKNPLVVAKNSYQGMTPEQDQVTGIIIMTSRSPNYIIEYLDR